MFRTFFYPQVPVAPTQLESPTTQGGSVARCPEEAEVPPVGWLLTHPTEPAFAALAGLVGAGWPWSQTYLSLCAHRSQARPRADTGTKLNRHRSTHT